MNAVTSDLLEQQSLRIFSEKAYRDYSMYVVLDRALPHIADGLKPVQRRIVYAMSELGLDAQAKYKKSARTVGDVLGKFHPHGDTACYEAMVLMAQNFSYRYQLIDGQGNWGSQDDPKSFAAMRYTEAKLSPYAELLLQELAFGTVDWQPNFDGTLEEPKLLPARVPNILLNGSTGIAVGMATDIPPHNLREVINALVYLLDHPKASLDEICELLPAPDFPTNAEIITSKTELKTIYQTGNGMIKLRAIYEIEDDEIVITALPHQVSGAKVLEQIAKQMQEKKLPQVVDLRDESDHENPTRLVIVPRSNRVDTDAIMSHLFATTDLEKSIRVNLNMIGIDGKPKTKNLLTILSEWLHYRTQTVTRRLQFRLEKIKARLHILAGFLIAYLNIDEVIKIIREEDQPKEALIQRFQLSSIQAEAILEIKLRQLAKLEEIKIREESDRLQKEQAEIEHILSNEKALKKLIKTELNDDAKKYGDARRSPLVERQQAQIMIETERVAQDPVTIILSEKGWIRCAKGLEIDAEKLSYKSGDQLLMIAQGKANQLAVFYDSTGRTYSIPAHTLPSARGQGEPLTGKLNLPANAVITAVTMGEAEELYLLASSAGYGFIAKQVDLYSKNRSGKNTLTLPDKSQILLPRKILVVENAQIAALCSSGRLLIFPANELPFLAKGKGNKIIQLKENETLIDLAILENESSQLVIMDGHKKDFAIKSQDLTHFLGKRGQRGHALPRGLNHPKGLKVNVFIK